MEEVIKNLGWPHLITLFAIVFILVFRKSLSGLISRITSIDKTGSGVRITTTPEVQREEHEKEAVQELLSAIGDSIVLREVEDRIKSDLKLKGLETTGDTVTVLIKHLAATRMLLEFEKIHGVIFRSQIYLLKKLNEVRGQGQPKEFIISYFENVKKRFSDSLEAWSLDQYLSFLFNNFLLTVENNRYHISNLGVEYLTWIARDGKSEDKPF